MRWLLDQGLPRSSADLLRASGEDAVHAGEVGLAEATDAEVLKRADDENRIVVTLDADFHALLAMNNAESPSVIRVREEGLLGPDIHSLVLRISKQFSADLLNGCVLTFAAGKARLRHLPIRSESEDR